MLRWGGGILGFDAVTSRLTYLFNVIGRVIYLIYVSMRHYVLTTSVDIVVCFHTAVCLSC